MRRAAPSILTSGSQLRWLVLRKDLVEGPLDQQIGDKSRKGPQTAHGLSVYKTAHKLQQSARWKTANVVTNVVGGKDYRLRETHGEGRVDETGVYRDWLYGDERRIANYTVIALFCTSMSLFYYTLKTMSSETWDIPAPLMEEAPELAGQTTTKDSLLNPPQVVGGQTN